MDFSAHDWIFEVMTTRRSFTTSVLGAVAGSAAGREDSYSRNFPDMLLQHLVSRLNGLADKWDAERARISSAAQVESRNRDVRQAMLTMLGGFPERCPLNARTAKVFYRKGYTVENVIFQSRPDFYVTGNLYVPASPPAYAKPPYPGIISPCGHYGDARMDPEYQSVYIHLALAGFVVLAYDPVGQGERRQYWNPATNTTEVGGATTEHSMAGQLLLLMGENLTHYRVWDGIRAVDYLLNRKEVDPERIGCAGHSGGGTLTRFIAPLEPRIKVAVINEGGTANRWPFDLRPESRIGPSDVEQNLFPSARLGVDHVDMQAAIAPRPLLCLIENYSPAFTRAATRIAERYRQIGSEDRFATEEATDPHAWTPKLRLATSRWFSRWFYGQSGPAAEPDFEIEPVTQLYSTATGSIRESGPGETMFGTTRRKAAALPSRKPVTQGRLREILRIPRAGTDLRVRHLVTTQRKGYSVEKVEFISEPGIYIPAWVFVPLRRDTSKPATIWVHEAGKESEGMEFGRLERRTRQGELLVAIDVRGIGETRPPHATPGSRPGDFAHLFDLETAMTYLAWYMDESLFGMRVLDVVRAVDYTLSRKDAGGKSVDVHGRGAGALWALFAAALDERIQSVTAERMLLSYRSLAVADRYLHGAGSFIKDILNETDLPQVAGMVAPRRVSLVEPVDAMKRRVSSTDVHEAYGAYGNVVAVPG